LTQFGILDLVDWHAGGPVTQAERFRQVIESAVVAEELGFETFWVGEHHFSHYICSHPAVLLSAIAARTSRIRIGTAVCLAAHHDPVRLAEDYAMADVISQGRLDLVLGRGLFLEGYRGFNMPFGEARSRLEEAAAIIRGAWTTAPFTFEGRYRQVAALEVQPRPVQQPHPPIWIAGGRSPESVAYAAREGFNLALPQIQGPVETYRPVAEAYRSATSGRLVSAGSHIYVGDDDATAEREFQGPFVRYLAMVAAELREDLYAGTESEEMARRARSAPSLDPVRLVRGGTRCGGAERVAGQTVEMIRVLGLDHCWGHFATGGLPQPGVLRSMERFARDVRPAVERALATGA
jgi:alkanesulfonate monooxygenase SsuD/methylene tetrahydromethanopterin reductase-like flavin-dependent oxidoreductase (luciferase family)